MIMTSFSKTLDVVDKTDNVPWPALRTGKATTSFKCRPFTPWGKQHVFQIKSHWNKQQERKHALFEYLSKEKQIIEDNNLRYRKIPKISPSKY